MIQTGIRLLRLPPLGCTLLHLRNLRSTRVRLAQGAMLWLCRVCFCPVFFHPCVLEGGGSRRITHHTHASKGLRECGTFPRHRLSVCVPDLEMAVRLIAATLVFEIPALDVWRMRGACLLHADIAGLTQLEVLRSDTNSSSSELRIREQLPLEKLPHVRTPHALLRL